MLGEKVGFALRRGAEKLGGEGGDISASARIGLGRARRKAAFATEPTARARSGSSTSASSRPPSAMVSYR